MAKQCIEYISDNPKVHKNEIVAEINWRYLSTRTFDVIAILQAAEVLKKRECKGYEYAYVRKSYPHKKQIKQFASFLCFLLLKAWSYGPGSKIPQHFIFHIFLGHFSIQYISTYTEQSLSINIRIQILLSRRIRNPGWSVSFLQKVKRSFLLMNSSKVRIE